MEYEFGIEEELFVVCEHTQVLQSDANVRFLARAKQLSDGAVTRELLQSQVEAVTPVCRDIAEARQHLLRTRAALATAGRETGLSVIAAGTHPTALWPAQQQTQKTRYDDVMDPGAHRSESEKSVPRKRELTRGFSASPRLQR